MTYLRREEQEEEERRGEGHCCIIHSPQYQTPKAKAAIESRACIGLFL
jgi:hypothetical protein